MEISSSKLICPALFFLKNSTARRWDPLPHRFTIGRYFFNAWSRSVFIFFWKIVLFWFLWKFENYIENTNTSICRDFFKIFLETDFFVKIFFSFVKSAFFFLKVGFQIFWKIGLFWIKNFFWKLKNQKKSRFFKIFGNRLQKRKKDENRQFSKFFEKPTEKFFWKFFSLWNWVFSLWSRFPKIFENWPFLNFSKILKSRKKASFSKFLETDFK